MIKTKAKIKKIETVIIAKPSEGMSLNELKLKLEELGNPIIEINEKENYIKMVHNTKEN